MDRIDAVTEFDSYAEDTLRLAIDLVAVDKLDVKLTGNIKLPSSKGIVFSGVCLFACLNID